VLAFILHFYVHSLPPHAEPRIPPPITTPLFRVSKQLQLPPLLTYSDMILYNWAPIHNDSDWTLTAENIRCQTSFTGTPDEAHFYLCSAHVELRGAEALSLMCATMDELFVGDAIANRRISDYLHQLAPVVNDFTEILSSLRAECNPDVFCDSIRPWFVGPVEGKWIYEGSELIHDFQEPDDLTGPSGSQSSTLHALDTFLGVSQFSHGCQAYGSSAPAECPFASRARKPPPKESFLTRMQSYMPRHHRHFLEHLSATPRPLRAFVVSSDDSCLLDAYNSVVNALKGFRDVHLRIVAYYVVGPLCRRRQAQRDAGVPKEPLRGTSGTDIVRFLKEVRNQTTQAKLAPMDCAGSFRF
jgi:indoleamine 2,3-dioxygenase